MVTGEFNFQTSVAEDLWQAFKDHASDRGMLGSELFAEALQDFLEHRAMLRKNRQQVPYLFAPADGKTLNVRVPIALAEKVDATAKEDRVPAKLFIYSALVSYAVTHKLIGSIGTIESGVVTADPTKMKSTAKSAPRRR